MTKVVANILPKDSPEFRKIKSAINVMDECNSKGKWRKDYLQTISNALDIVLDVYPALAADRS